MRNPILICCLLLPLLALARAENGRTCRVLFLGAAESDPETLHLHDGTEIREVELPRMNFSKTYKLPAGVLTLRLLEAPPAEGETVDPGGPSVTVGENTGDCYLLVMPDPSNKVLPVKMEVINASADRFKAGQMMWFNLTPNDVGGQVGDQRLVLKGRSTLILDQPVRQSGGYPVDLSFRIPGKEHVYPLCETRWVHDPASRTVLFVINETGARTPRVLGFPDHRRDVEDTP